VWRNLSLAPYRMTFILLILTIAWTSLSTFAQDSITLNCDDGQTFTDVFALDVLNPSEDETLYYTVLGLDATQDAILGIDDGEFAYCNMGDDIAEVYTGTLPSAGDIASSPLNATDFIGVPPPHRVMFGDFNGQAGDFVLVVEGLLLDGLEDVYSLPLPSTLRDAETSIRIYALADNDALGETTLGMRALDGDADVVRCDAEASEGCLASEGFVLTTFDANYSADDVQSALQISPADVINDALALRIGTPDLQSEIPEATYALVLHIARGAEDVASISASYAQDNDGSMMLTCRGDDMNDIRLDGGIRFDVPEGMTQITTLSNPDAETILGLFGDDTSAGDCILPVAREVNWQVDLPFVNASMSPTHAQTMLDDSETVVMTWQALSNDENEIAFEGDLVVVFEGILPDEGFADVALSLIAPMLGDDALHVTLVALGDWDAELSLVRAEGEVMMDDDGVAIVCNDAGYNDCYGDSDILAGSGITLADEDWTLLTSDANLSLAIADTLPRAIAGDTLHWRIAARDIEVDAENVEGDVAERAYVVIMTWRDTPNP
jgi:hypothetical protein